MKSVSNDLGSLSCWLEAKSIQIKSQMNMLVQRIVLAVKECFYAIVQLPLKLQTFLNSLHQPSPVKPTLFSRRATFIRCGSWSKIHQASYQHKNRQLEKLLELPSNQNVMNQEYVTPLHAAVYKGNIQGVKLLVAAGANTEARDKYGQTPMHWAAYKGHVAIINLLFILGADIDARDHQNKTPLRVAVKNGYLDATSTLLALGADLEAEDSKKQTPYFIAKLYGHREIAQYLADLGANTAVVNSAGCSAAESAGRGCLRAYIRQFKPFGSHELNSASRRHLQDKVVMIALAS